MFTLVTKCLVNLKFSLYVWTCYFIMILITCYSVVKICLPYSDCVLPQKLVTASFTSGTQASFKSGKQLQHCYQIIFTGSFYFRCIILLQIWHFLPTHTHFKSKNCLYFSKFWVIAGSVHRDEFFHVGREWAFII